MPAVALNVNAKVAILPSHMQGNGEEKDHAQGLGLILPQILAWMSSEKNSNQYLRLAL